MEKINWNKPDDIIITLTKYLNCPICRGPKTLIVGYDENECARWGHCNSCGGDGPFDPCQECTKDPKPCNANETDESHKKFKLEWRDCADCKYQELFSIRAECQDCFDDPAHPYFELGENLIVE